LAVSLLPRVDGAAERMDAPDVDPAALEQALRHVAAVNRWLGGRRALLRHLHGVLPAVGGRVLDVGAGAGDLPLAVDSWATRLGRATSVTMVDLHARTLAVAHRNAAGRPRVAAVRANGLELPFAEGVFDLALLSMTLHHLEGEDRVRVLVELARVARGGRVVVAELHRALPNYLGARLLAATLWRHNPVTRHDGPLSVRRAFTPAELLDLARRAGLGEPRVQRHVFYRLVLTATA
jgi:SAM-dependent methyltransferase